MALPTGFFSLGRPISGPTFPSSGNMLWSAEINGFSRSIEAIGEDLDGIFLPEEFRLPRLDWLFAPELNLSRPGLDASLGAVLGGGWVGTDFDDVVGGFNAPVRLFLAHGNDSGTGSTGSDLIAAGAGDDTLDGGGGRDLLDGGSGDDVIRAAPGDTVDGQMGSDTLALNSATLPVGALYKVRLDERVFFGNDNAEGYVEILGTTLSLTGLYSIENVEGSSGSDDIMGSAEANMLLGNSGDDTLDGRAGSDTLSGGAGFDFLIGGHGADLLDGGDDDDQFWAGFGRDTLNGGAGIDTYLVEQPVFDGSLDVILATQADIDLGMGTAHLLLPDAAQPNDAIAPWWIDPNEPGGGLISAIDSGFHLLAEIENATGGVLTDRLLGSSQANLLDGGDSGDILDGRGGSDTLIGGGGNDMMRGGTGFDTADFAATIRPLLIELWRGRAQSEATGVDSLFEIERIIGGGGNDTLVGDVISEELKGESGNDLMFGNAGNDTLWGGQGADTIRGEQGADKLLGDWANDILLGDDGNDTLFGFFGDDVLFGWTGRDRLLGEQGNDSLFGEQGDDFLGGLEENDFLIGGEGNDVIFGDDGDDFLGGHAGVDVLVGGRGRDTMWGDDGADLFIFRPEDLEAGVTDLIASFSGIGPAADTIRLASIPIGNVVVSQIGADAQIRIGTMGGGFAEIIVQGAAAADVNARLAYF
jgi:Ca2+-binding RTX toxin-like protein